MQSQVERLLGLAIIVVVALGGLLLLLRLSGRSERRHRDILLGYPPELFPDRELIRSAPLQALAATQARLATIHGQLPQQSDVRVWLRAFLNELREIMDTAYRVAIITRAYGKPVPIERLVAEVQEIEAQVAEQVTQRLLSRDGDRQQELLDGRLATLRLCMRELADLTYTAPRHNRQQRVSAPPSE